MSKSNSKKSTSAIKESKKEATQSPDKSNGQLIKVPLFPIQIPISEFLKKNEVSIITGAAGTSKDHICMFTALKYLSSKDNIYDKIIITKPIVEVGQSIGFMPGDENEKIAPYRKSFDAIVSTIIGNGDSGRVANLKKRIVFEPINFIRGDTFKNAIVILSEAQNCTLHELISYITRLDKSSKLFINGDLMQSDIGRKSGLKDLLNIVEKVEGIEKITLGDEFQTRNKMIVKLNKEYNKYRSQQ